MKSSREHENKFIQNDDLAPGYHISCATSMQINKTREENMKYFAQKNLPSIDEFNK